MLKSEIISTPHAPKVIGPYSQGVVSPGGRTLFTAGQIGLDPQSGELVSQSDVGRQTEQVFVNLGAVLKAAGMDFHHIVRCGIYLIHLSDFPTVNAIYERFFSKDPPARTTIQVAALPKGALIEIDAIAVES